MNEPRAEASAVVGLTSLSPPPQPKTQKPMSPTTEQAQVTVNSLSSSPLSFPDHTAHDLTPFGGPSRLKSLYHYPEQSFPDGTKDFSNWEREREREKTRTCVSAFRGCLLRCGDRLDSSIIMHGKMLHFMVPGTSDHKNEGKIIL